MAPALLMTPQRIVYPFFIAAAIAVVAGCSGRQTTLSPQEEHLADAYTEILFLHDQYIRTDTTVNRETYQHRIDSTLALFQLTQATFKTQFAAIGDTPERSKLFFEAVETKLDHRRTRTP